MGVAERAVWLVFNLYQHGQDPTPTSFGRFCFHFAFSIHRKRNRYENRLSTGLLNVTYSWLAEIAD